MWSPTHVQVVVQKARQLPVKGKHGTNDAFVTIQLGKEKFQTSVKEKVEIPEWNEECELTIPDGNTSNIVLTVLHRNFVGLDKFLGQVQIPLNELEIYERARSRWYTLEGRPGKASTKKRGELEVRISFTVKSVTGSLMDLSKKPKKTNSLPLKMVQSVGGSLMNLASKEKKLGHFPFKLANYGHKLSEKFPLKSKNKNSPKKIDEQIGELDVEDDRFSQMSSYNSDEEINSITGNSPIPVRTDIPQTPEKPQAIVKKDATDEWESKLLGMPVPQDIRRHTIQGIRSSKSTSEVEKAILPKTSPIESIKEIESSDSAIITTNSSPTVRSARQQYHQPVISPKTPNAKSPTKLLESKIDRAVTPPSPVKNHNKFSPISERSTIEKLYTKNSRLLSNLSKDKVEMFEKMSKEDLVELIVCQQSSIDLHLKQIRDLEDYIDNLLVRVMETTPRILQKSYKIAPSVR